MLTVTFALQENSWAGGGAESSRQQYEIARNKRGGGNRTTHTAFLSQAWCSHARPCCLKMRNISKPTTNKTTYFVTWCWYVHAKHCVIRWAYSGHERISHQSITTHYNNVRVLYDLCANMLARILYNCTVIISFIFVRRSLTFIQLKIPQNFGDFILDILDPFSIGGHCISSLYCRWLSQSSG